MVSKFLIYFSSQICYEYKTFIGRKSVEIYCPKTGTHQFCVDYREKKAAHTEYLDFTTDGINIKYYLNKPNTLLTWNIS